MSDKKFNASKFMKYTTWSSAILLLIIIANNTNEPVAINVSEQMNYYLGFAVIAMLVVNLFIGSHLASDKADARHGMFNHYLELMASIGITGAALFSAYLPAEQMYALAVVGVLTMLRRIYPIFIEHRDEMPSADVIDIKEHTSTGGSKPRRRRAS